MKSYENFSSPEKREFGKNIKVVLEFLRHSTPGKTPEGMSADFLTDDGKDMSRNMGKERPQEEHIGAYSSPAMRAQETADLYLDNTEESVGVVNKRTADINVGLKGQKEDNAFRIKTRKELAPVDNFGKIMPLAKEYAKNQKEAGSQLDDLTLIIQYYLDHPEECEKNGVDLPRESAAAIAYRVAIEIGMTDRFYDDSDVRLINVTHGPKLEPFLQELIGFENLEEIGGALKEGENFQFIINIDDNKNKKIILVFRDKEYDLTEEQINTISELSSEFKDKLKKEKER